MFLLEPFHVLVFFHLQFSMLNQSPLAGQKSSWFEIAVARKTNTDTFLTMNLLKMTHTKSLATLVLVLTGIGLAQAGPAVPREDCLKTAMALAADLDVMLDTPIPTDPDLKRPVALRSGERGALVLPESKLTMDVLNKADKEVIPIGQLWLHLAALQNNEEQTYLPAQLQIVTVNMGQNPATATLHALGVRKNEQGKLEILFYGKDKEPLFGTLLKEIEAEQEHPLEMTWVEESSGVVVTLKLLGKYEATFKLVPL